MATLYTDDESSQASPGRTSYLDPPNLDASTENDGELASCWTATKASAMDVGMGGLLTISGLATIAFGVSLIVQNGPQGPAGGIVCAIAGGLLLAGGLFFLLYKAFGPQMAIVVTEDGIEVLQKQQSRKLLWQEIHKVQTLDFFPHRLSELVLVVWIEPVNGTKIRFDTQYEGDPVEVVRYLTTNCDYIVRNPSGYTKYTS